MSRMSFSAAVENVFSRSGAVTQTTTAETSVTNTTAQVTSLHVSPVLCISDILVFEKDLVLVFI